MRKKEYEELKKTVAEVERFVRSAEYVKNVWFWEGNNGNADWLESRGEALSDYAEWEEGGHKWTADLTVTLTRRYTRVDRDYRKDGEKTNLKAIKNSLARMQKTLDEETERREKREARKQARLAKLAETAQAVTDAVTGAEPEPVMA